MAHHVTWVLEGNRFQPRVVSRADDAKRHEEQRRQRAEEQRQRQRRQRQKNKERAEWVTEQLCRAGATIGSVARELCRRLER